eukprot:m.26108 g.26108  ORF g.26108 m.26108 type:complete len:616 (+) comp4292_c0_seq1:218-2065(+)
MPSLGLHLALTATIAAAVGAQGAPRNRPTHLVFIVVDDWGFNDVGFRNRNNSADIHTPTMDALAANGVVLDSYYVNMACTPTRSSFLSGRYQIHTGLQHGVIGECQPNALPTNATTIAEALKQLGYTTVMFGKWHLGYHEERFTPWRRGFDTFVGFLNSAEDQFNHTIIRACPWDVNHTAGFAWQCGAHMGRQCLQDTQCDFGLDLRTGNNGAPDLGSDREEYSTMLYTRQAVATIESHGHGLATDVNTGDAGHNSDSRVDTDSSTPLFVYLSYSAVHIPLEAPASYMARFAHITDLGRRTLVAMTACVDDGVANVTAALKRSGLYNDTVMVISTDNGGPFGDIYSNYPLRGGKAMLFEGGLRGTGIVHSPLLQSPGRVYTGLIGAVDIAPTLLSIATNGNADLMATLMPAMDGVDQWAAIREDTNTTGLSPPRTELLHNIDPLGNVPLDRIDTSPFEFPRHHRLTRQQQQQRQSAAPRYARAAIRVGRYKLLVGDVGEIGHPDPDTVGWGVPSGWTPPHSPPPPPPPPGTHCRVRRANDTALVFLFDIEADPEERCDLSASMPAVVSVLMARLDVWNATAVPVRFPDSEPNAASPCRRPRAPGGVPMWGPWNDI